MKISRRWFLVLLLAGVLSSRPASAVSQKGSLLWGGLNRTYRFYVPAHLPARRKIPLLIALHGRLGTGEGMEKLTLGRFNELADQNGFIVVYPDGVGKSWNDGRPITGDQAHDQKVDDVGFISALIDHFETDFRADPRRVYATGMSNGAILCCRLACELSTRIAAAAPVAGSLAQALEDSCRPLQPVSMLFINGENDPLVPFQGGDVHFFLRKRGKILSLPQAAALWARRDGCGGHPVTQTLPAPVQDHTTVDQIAYAPSAGGSEVILDVIHGGGHTWPNGQKYAGEWLVGRVSHNLDACGVIWDFFKRHSR